MDKNFFFFFFLNESTRTPNTDEGKNTYEKGKRKRKKR